MRMSAATFHTGIRALTWRLNGGSQDVRNVDAGMFSAIMMGERKGIQEWLDRGASLHAVNKRGQTALMLCSNVETLDWLISEGVPVDARDNGGATALFVAAERANPEIVRLLLKHGADVNTRNTRAATALFGAAAWHKPQIVRLLLDYGADANARRNGGYTPLMSAAWPWPTDSDAVETLSLLLSRGADVNAVDEQGRTALIHLLRDEQHDAGYEDIVRLLLANNADTGIVDSEGNTALSLSMHRRLNDVVALLTQAQ